MSRAEPFVAQLRVRPDATIRMVEPGAPAITVRVQMYEVWDTIRVEVAPTEPVLALKVRALEALYPTADFHDDFVCKVNGFEVLDENASLTEAGMVDGSTLFLAYRRRRPIKYPG